MKGTCPNCGQPDREQVVMHGMTIAGCECVGDRWIAVQPKIATTTSIDRMLKQWMDGWFGEHLHQTYGPDMRNVVEPQASDVACGHRYPDGAPCARPRGHDDDPEHASSCSRAITEPSEPRRYAGCPIPTCCGVTMRIAELVDAVECVTCKRVVTALELIAERDAEWDRISTCEQWQSVDPLDVEYEGVTLRKLLQIDLEARQEIGGIGRSGLSPIQRSAVAAHWSAELRSRVAAAKAKERERVVLDADPEDL